MKKFLIIALVLLINGCATMGQGSQDRVKIATIDDSSTKTICSAKNEESQKNNITPLQEFAIERDGNPLVINCQNETQTGQKSVEAVFDDGYLAQDLFLDLCIISCLIDGGTNAFYDYPEAIYINMINR